MFNAIKKMALTAAIVSLWGCAPIDHTHGPSVSVERDFDDLPLFIDGKPVQDFVGNTDELLNILKTLARNDPDIDLEDESGISKVKSDLMQLRRNELRGDDVPRSFRGVSGLSNVLAFRLALFGEIPETKGKIRDFIFDKDKKNGHIAVDMRTRIFMDWASYGKGVPDRIEFRHWDVEILKGFEIHERNEDPTKDHLNDPFPGTVTFPDEALGAGGSIRVRGLDHKVFAKGEDIVVRHVYERIDNGKLKRLPDDDGVYDSTPDDCVDILFAGPPPETYSEFPPQIGYCLGRCEDPYIMNSK